MQEIAVELDESTVPATMVVVVDGTQSRQGGGAESPERVGFKERTADLGAQMTSVAAATFKDSLGAIPAMGEAVLERIESMQRRPQEVEVTMGFKIGAKGTIKLVETGGEAHFQVTFRWSASDETGGPQ